MELEGLSSSASQTSTAQPAERFGAVESQKRYAGFQSQLFELAEHHRIDHQEHEEDKSKDSIHRCNAEFDLDQLQLKGCQKNFQAVTVVSV